MTAEDLIKAVCQYNQEQINQWSKECFTKPTNLLSKMFEDMVGSSYMKVSPVSINLIEQECEFPKLELLQTEVKTGHWVYSFFCSADIHDFQWCVSLDHALRYYISLRNEPFCGARVILFATETEVSVIEVNQPD